MKNLCKNISCLKRQNAEHADKDCHLFPVLGSGVRSGGTLSNRGLSRQQWGQGTRVAVSSAGQAVSDCQQGYHVGGGTVALVVPETEWGDHHSLLISF